MKAKIGLMILPLLVAVGGAMAQEGEQQGAAGAAEPAAAQTQAPIQARAEMRKEVRRQGADMRRCLGQKSNAAIIRCAEPGRKP